MKDGSIIGLIVGIGTYAAIGITAAIIDYNKILGESKNTGSTLAIILISSVFIYLIVKNINENPNGVARIKIENKKIKVIMSIVSVFGMILLSLLAVIYLRISWGLLLVLSLSVVIYCVIYIIRQDGVYEDYFWIKGTKININKIKEYKIENTRISLSYNKKFLFVKYLQSISTRCKEAEAMEIAKVMSNRSV